MFKTVHEKVWVFDCEWVPDPLSGRAAYDYPESMSDREVIENMWKEGGATDDDPMPFLKTVLCRIVSISAVIRTIVNGEAKVRLLSLPHYPQNPEECVESVILDSFLNAIGQHKPQLIGYNSHSSDIKILIQRAIINGNQAPEFCHRPAKPWEGVDYFARGSEFNIDLMEIVGSWGKAAPSLHEIATAAGIPGKIEIDGNQVASLWLNGEMEKIVAYNEYDALTTYLLWLKTAHFAGFFSSVQYKQEQEKVKKLLESESDKDGRNHLKTYLKKWNSLTQLVNRAQSGVEFSIAKP
ncbi:3'-5' exonuclease [bacterium]|nr:3'-5' exonuclease [bacterium]